MKGATLLLIVSFCFGIMYAKENEHGKKAKKKVQQSRLTDCGQTRASAELNINNVRALLQLGGDMWWDFDHARYEVPKVEDGQLSRNSLFAGALWLGGFDNAGNLKLAAQTYRQFGENDYFAGPLRADGTTDIEICTEFDRFYESLSSEIEEFLADYSDGVLDDPIPKNILEWPGNGNPNILSEFRGNELAPFWDENRDTKYNPVDGDYPILQKTSQGEPVVPDQMFWWVFNDAGGPHTESEALALGIEVHTTAFAFQTSDALNNTTFYNYKLINKASQPLDSTFMSVWADPDLGDYNDDYVGCNIEEGLGIVYNADDFDGGQGGYGTEIPMLGIDYFRGPQNEFGEELPMTRFSYYINITHPVFGDPQTGQEYYGYMSGTWKDGSYHTFGGDGTDPANPRTNFMYPGDPSNSAEWSECSVGTAAQDKRMLQVSGPFRLEPGAVNDITVGVVWIPEANYPCPSFDVLLQADKVAQALFDNEFKVKDGPDAPDLEIMEFDKKIVIGLMNSPGSNNFNLGYREKDLSISLEPGEDPERAYYHFQGYQIYQLRNSSVSVTEYSNPDQARLVKQMDITDGVTRLINYTNQNEFGFVGEEMVDGSDSGLESTVEIGQDLFSDPSPELVNNNVYYFSVVAYAYNDYTAFDPAHPYNELGQLEGQLKPYLRGRKNIRVYKAVPHDQQLDGFQLNAQIGERLEIVKLDGAGNGDNNLKLAEGEEVKILEETNGQQVKYKPDNSPIEVKVTQPKKLRAGTFELRMIDPALSNNVLSSESTWQLSILGNEIVSERTIEVPHEQYLVDSLGGEYGISVRLGQVPEVGSNPEDSNNGFITAHQSDVSWLRWLQDTDDGSIADWIKSGTDVGDRIGLDDSEIYESVMDGSFSPTALISASHYGPGGDMSVGVVNSLSMSQTKSYNLIITTDKNFWTKCAVLEMGIDETKTIGETAQFGIRQSNSLDKNGNEITGEVGRSWFPGYAIDMESGRRVNITFAEDSSNPSDHGSDMLWNPTGNLYDGPVSAPSETQEDVPLAGMHYIYITDIEYEGDERGGQTVLDIIESNTPENGNISRFLKRVSWAAIPYLNENEQLLGSEVRIELRVKSPYSNHTSSGLNNGYPMYQFEITDDMLPQPLSYEAHSNLALEQINVVPNPYYAHSQFESGKTDKRVRFTNLPPQTTISIFDLDGTLIDRIQRNEPTLRGETIFVDWDLQNFQGLPIGSGMYIIHFEVPDVGVKTIKWFAVNRINDIETF